MILKKAFLFFFIFVIAMSFSHSQIIPTGKLDGTVFDETGQILPGVTVTIKSPSLILPQISYVANEKGYYRFGGLPSGKYQVKFEMPGMKTVIREGIFVTVTRSTTLNINLTIKTLEESITVIGKAPTLDMQKTASGVVLKQLALESLPIARHMWTIMHLAPGMYNRSSHGSDARSNKFTIDGMMHQDPVTGDPIMEAGYNMMEEILVETGMHKAEHGAAKGAVVQVLTKSGGNEFSGRLEFYARLKALQSDNTKGTPFEGDFIGFDHEYDPGLSLGGPVKKDKLWFFGSMNYLRRIWYVQGYPWNEEQNQPLNRDVYIPYLKFTWQVTPKTRVTASTFWRGYYQDHRDANRYKTVDVSRIEDRGGWLHSLQWTKIFNPDLFLNIRAGYYDFHQTLLAKNDLPPTADYENYFRTGGTGSDWWYTRDRVQLDSDLTYFVDDMMGSHEFKMGMSFQYSISKTDNFYYQASQFDGLWPAGFKAVDIWLDHGVPYRVWVGEEYTKEEHSLEYGLYIQDTWAPTRRVTVNLGLRFDLSQGRFPAQNKKYTNEPIYTETVIPMTWRTLSPRLGINYDPFGDNKTVIKVGYGRYYSPMYMLLFLFSNANQRRSFSARLNPDWSVNYTYGHYEPATNQIDPDGVTAPYTDEISIGFEREIIEDVSFSAMYIRKWERDLIEDVDLIALDVDYFKESGEMRWNHYTLVQGIDPMTGDFISFYNENVDKPTSQVFFMNIPGTVRKYWALEFKLQKRMSRNWGGMISYVWSRGVGWLNTSRGQSTAFSGYYDNPNSMINAYGVLSHQREHVIKFYGTVNLPFGISSSFFYLFGSGIPYSRTLRSLEAGLNLYQGVVSIFAEERGGYRLPASHELNIRLEKKFQLGPGTLSLILDGFQLPNLSTATSLGTITGVDWERVWAIQSPRYFRLGISYSF